MFLLIVIFLAALQGVAEFLPISSSGHLLVFEAVFGLEDLPILFDVMLHIGTLVAVIIVYRDQLLRVWRGAISGWRRPGESYRRSADFRLGVHLILAMGPTTLMVLGLRQIAKVWAGDLALVGVGLLGTATVLSALGGRTRKNRLRGEEGRGLETMGWRDALWIGAAQGLSATFRGLSRSGSTITAGVFLGFSQQAAASFSFLLSIPAILGALVYTARDFDGETQILGYGVIGGIVAAIVGYFALRWLLNLIDRGRLYLFAFWCAGMGLFAILWRFLS